MCEDYFIAVSFRNKDISYLMTAGKPKHVAAN